MTISDYQKEVNCLKVPVEQNSFSYVTEYKSDDILMLIAA